MTADELDQTRIEPGEAELKVLDVARRYALAVASDDPASIREHRDFATGARWVQFEDSAVETYRLELADLTAMISFQALVATCSAATHELFDVTTEQRGALVTCDRVTTRSSPLLQQFSCDQGIHTSLVEDVSSSRLRTSLHSYGRREKS